MYFKYVLLHMILLIYIMGHYVIYNYFCLKYVFEENDLFPSNEPFLWG